MPDEEARGPEETPTDDVAERLREMEEGLARARATAGTDDLDAEFAARADAIRERAAASVERQRQAAEKAEAPAKAGAESHRGLAIGMSIAYAIVGVPLVGFGLGWLADRGTGGVVFQAIGLLTGCVLALVHVVRVLARR